MSRRRAPGEPPPLKLRRHRRLLPELELPSVRGRRREHALNEPVVRVTLPQQITPAEDAPAIEPAPAAMTEAPRKPPLYWRLLRLRHIHPNGWQRALLAEGVLAVALVLVLAEKASVWTLLVLPVVVAALVKVNDLLAGGLRNAARSGEEPRDVESVKS